MKMNRIIIAAAINTMIGALYGLYVTETDAREWRLSNNESVTVYGHRIAPGGKLTILTSR